MVYRLAQRATHKFEKRTTYLVLLLRFPEYSQNCFFTRCCRQAASKNKQHLACRLRARINNIWHADCGKFVFLSAPTLCFKSPQCFMSPRLTIYLLRLNMTIDAARRVLPEMYGSVSNFILNVENKEKRDLYIYKEI